MILSEGLNLLGAVYTQWKSLTHQSYWRIISETLSVRAAASSETLNGFLRNFRFSLSEISDELPATVPPELRKAFRRLKKMHQDERNIHSRLVRHLAQNESRLSTDTVWMEMHTWAEFASPAKRIEGGSQLLQQGGLGAIIGALLSVTIGVVTTTLRGSTATAE